MRLFYWPQTISHLNVLRSPSGCCLRWPPYVVSNIKVFKRMYISTSWLMSFIQDNASTCVFIVGDMNANVSDGNSLFSNQLLQCCSGNGLFLSSKMLLPKNSYTYISEAWHTASWLDHWISTADAHNTIESKKINYEFVTTDHVPLTFTVNWGNVPAVLCVNINMCVGKIDRSNLSEVPYGIPDSVWQLAG